VPFKPELEKRVATLDAADAAEALLRGYGPELLSFLHAILASELDADEAFAIFSEDLWRGLPSFRAESTYRTWCYQLARHAAYRLRRGDERRRNRFEQGGTTAAERIAWNVRTTTAAFKRTSAQDALAAMRDALTHEDRELLVLRLDRGLEWADVATVMEIDAATLRKRFERLKDKMRTKAKRAGIVTDDDSTQ